MNPVIIRLSVPAKPLSPVPVYVLVPSALTVTCDSVKLVPLSSVYVPIAPQLGALPPDMPGLTENSKSELLSITEAPPNGSAELGG